MTKQNKTNNYRRAESCTGNSINELQKAEIRKAILSAIENGYYYPNLAEDACKAISYINNFSDAICTEELVDIKTSEIFRKT